MDERIRKVILNLQQNNMAGYFVENKKELLPYKANRSPFGCETTQKRYTMYEVG
jgi:hypothetical protein